MRSITQCFFLFLSVLSYSALNGQVNLESSNLPIVIIQTNEAEIVDDPRIAAYMGIINNEEGRNHIDDDHNDYAGQISIEIRGNTSQDFPKKQYGLETQNELGENNNVSLLGMPEENDWILAAPYSDKTLFRNVLAFSLSEMLGHYAPRTKFCELVINNEYKGVYVLTEKIKRDKNRVDIAKLTEQDVSGDDITGGHIIKIDRYVGNVCNAWQSDYAEIYFQHEYPKCDEITDAQKNYIRDYVDAFEVALFSGLPAHSPSGYAQYVDMNSLVDFFLVNEISKNIDGYRLSTFMYKDKDSKGGKLTFGPVWDFNLAFANADYLDAEVTENYIASRNDWWMVLLEDSTFTAELENRWCEVSRGVWSKDSIFEKIDQFVSALEEGHQRNFEKWQILGEDIWPNFFVGSTYESEVNFLKTWLSARLNWMSTTINRTCDIQIEANTVELYPNPHSTYFTYIFALAKEGYVTVKIIDIQGREIERIMDNKLLTKGYHQNLWFADNTPTLEHNNLYFLTLEVNGKLMSTKRIIRNPK